MATNNFTVEMREKAKSCNHRIAYPDAEDVRTLQTAEYVLTHKIARPVLVGNPEAICKTANDNNVNIEGAEIVFPADSPDLDAYVTELYEKRKSKGMTPEQARELMLQPIFFSGMLLKHDKVKVVLGGNVSSTGDIIRASLFTVGCAPGIKTVSSFFIMAFPDKLICFGDCAVNPDPTDEQLADIAVTSAKNFKSITGVDPRVAMLSFSTNGSAEHPLVDKVKSAVQIAREKDPALMLDGEMQLDAALIPSIGERKFKGSPVAGKANVLIFPDLNAGNIGYKLTERLAGAEAVGPIVQGLDKPYCDLSRGCSTDDMINVSAICSLMA